MDWQQNRQGVLKRLVGRLKRGRGGSALVLAIVMTMMLFIIGLAFMLSGRTEKLVVSNAGTRESLDGAIEAVIEQINMVLVEDLFGLDSFGNLDLNMLDGGGDASGGVAGQEQDEYYDYPGPDDPWLASLEPELFNVAGIGLYAWRHITDLYGNDFGIVGFYDPDNSSMGAQWNIGDPISEWYVVSNSYLGNAHATPVRIIGENDGMQTILGNGNWNDPCDIGLWGARADADGDGVADSRWVPVQGVMGPRGQNFYTAVRIVDNCGMVNINTAYRYPDPCALVGIPEWDGSRLSHVNLEGIISSTDFSAGRRAATVQEFRYGTLGPAFENTMPDASNYQNDTQYEFDVAQRLLNPRIVSAVAPVQAYRPFDISDELELRNRYFLASPTMARCEQEGMWPVTFNPSPGAVGLENPYVPGPGVLSNWFDKVTCDWTPSNTNLGNYNRRILSTTYSFDRVMVPKLYDACAVLGSGLTSLTWPPSTGAFNPSTDDMPGWMVDAWDAWNNWGDSFGSTPPSGTWRYRPVDLNGVVTPAEIEVLAAAIWLGLPDSVTLGGLPQFSGVIAHVGGDIREWMACQLAVNLVDYVDSDVLVTDFMPGGTTDRYYGFEENSQMVFVTGLAVSVYDLDLTAAPPEEHHFAIELYNPGPGSVDLSTISLRVGGGAAINLAGKTVTGGKSFVIVDNGPAFATAYPAPDAVDGSLILSGGDDISISFSGGEGPNEVIKDLDALPSASVAGVTEIYEATRGDRYLEGLLSRFPVLAATFDPWVGPGGAVTTFDSYSTPTTAAVQTYTADGAVRTVGEFFSLFALGAMEVGGTYFTMPEMLYEIGGGDLTSISDGRLDAADEVFADVLKYVSVFNPFNDGVDNDNRNGADPLDEYELGVAGRINVNTAPWFVIAQLPWIQDPGLANNHVDKFKLANAIVAYRDKLELDITTWGPGAPSYANPTAPPSNTGRQDGMGLAPTVGFREDLGFASVAELLNVTHGLGGPPYDAGYDIRRYGRDTVQAPSGPDYTIDSAIDDLEERDVVFHRVSNLATVRSDVFTAYILVRLGVAGPQRRVIGIFDRSNVYGVGDKPRLVALHPVPDPY